MFNTLMPSMFELNQKLFKHLLDRSNRLINFQVLYAYYNVPVLYLHLIFITYLAVKTYKMKHCANQVLLEVEDEDLESFIQKCSGFI